MSDIPDTWVKVGSAEERDDFYEQLESENSDLREDNRRLRAQQTVLVEALSKAPQYVILAIRECRQRKSPPYMIQAAENDLKVMQEALATLDVPDPKEQR